MASLLGLACAVAAGAGAWRFCPPDKYTVRAMVQISAVPEAVLGKPAFATDAQFVYYQKTQMTLVKSQVVLGKALRDPEVATLNIVRQQPEPMEWLLRQLEVDYTQGPEILRISMKGDGPRELVVIVNAVMHAYLDEFVNTEEKNRKDRLAHLAELKAGHEEVLAGKRVVLGAFAPKLGGGDPRVAGVVQEAKAKELGAAKDDLLKVRAEKRNADRKVRALEAKVEADTPVPASRVEEELSKDPSVKAHQAQITKLESEVADVKSKTSSAQVAERVLGDRGTLDALEAARSALGARLKELRPETTRRLRAVGLADLTAELGRAKDALAEVDVQEGVLTKAVDDLARELRSFGEDAFKMAQSVREVEDEEKLVAAIADEMRTLNLQRLSPSRAKLLDEAVVTRPEESKKRLAVTGGAAAGALGLAPLLVAWWEFRKRKIASVDEVVCGFGVNLVGTLPNLPRPARHRLSAVADADTFTRWTESVNSLRTILLRGAVSGNVRVVMVTSAMQGEGKTSLSCHLAASLARSGRRTLLVDGDLRQPTAHRLFCLPRSPGLREVLSGGAGLSEAVRPSPVRGLSVLTAGEYDRTALECLAPGDARRLFERLKQDFDVVVIDSSPVLPVADSLSIAPHVDGVIFCILRHVSRMPHVSAALHRLKMVGTPVLGAILLGTDEDAHSYAYYAPAVAGA